MRNNLKRPCMLLSPSVRSPPSIGLEVGQFWSYDVIRLLDDGINRILEGVR
jgi:hypothetical protein